MKWFGVYNIIGGDWVYSIDPLYKFARRLVNEYHMDVHILGFELSLTQGLENELQTHDVKNGINIHISKLTPDSLQESCRYMIENADDDKRQMFIIPFCLMPAVTKLLSIYKHKREIAVITVDVNVGNPRFPAGHMQDKIVKEIGVTVNRITIKEKTETLPLHMVITSGILKDLKKYSLALEEWKEDIAKAILKMNEPFKSTAISKYGVDWMSAVYSLFEEMEVEREKWEKNHKRRQFFW